MLFNPTDLWNRASLVDMYDKQGKNISRMFSWESDPGPDGAAQVPPVSHERWVEFCFRCDLNDTTPTSQPGEMIKFHSCNYKLAEFEQKHSVSILLWAAAGED